MTKIVTLLQERFNCKPIHRVYQFYSEDIREIAEHNNNELCGSIITALSAGFAMGCRFQKNRIVKQSIKNHAIRQIDNKAKEA